MVKMITAFECEICHSVHDRPSDAIRCERACLHIRLHSEVIKHKLQYEQDTIAEQKGLKDG